jgi:hypothetical protein
MDSVEQDSIENRPQETPAPKLKRVLSEKQLDSLRMGREKALQNRKSRLAPVPEPVPEPEPEPEPEVPPPKPAPKRAAPKSVTPPPTPVPKLRRPAQPKVPTPPPAMSFIYV